MHDVVEISLTTIVGGIVPTVASAPTLSSGVCLSTWQWSSDDCLPPENASTLDGELRSYEPEQELQTWNKSDLTNEVQITDRSTS